jgi:uncharacterized protein YndB with AHSA1/START domain
MTKAKLEVIAPANEPVIITRRFIKASPARIFEAWTTPEHIRQWLGPRELTMVSCEVDLRVSGKYHPRGCMEAGMTDGYDRLEALLS